jgi:hypothetical protein
VDSEQVISVETRIETLELAIHRIRIVIVSLARDGTLDHSIAVPSEIIPQASELGICAVHCHAHSLRWA